MQDLCTDPTHSTTRAFMEQLGISRLLVCADCGKKVDRKDPKWEYTCDQCKCSAKAHGETIYTLCQQCKTCGFYVGKFSEG